MHVHVLTIEVAFVIVLTHRYLTSEWKVKRPQDEPKVFDNMTVNFPSVSYGY